MNFPFFRKKHPLLENLADLHVHILPGVDDGPATVDEAVRMATVAAANGIDTVAATPHCLNGVFVNRREDILSACEALNRTLAEKEVPVHVVPCAEVRLSHETLEALDDGRLTTLDDAGCYLFVELPDQVLTEPTLAVLRKIRFRRLQPVIVHPERNPSLQRDPSIMKALSGAGALGQVTAASLMGKFGGRPADAGRKMVSDGLVQLVASDAHGADHRTPDIRPVYRVLAGLIGKDRAWRMLVETPREMLGRREEVRGRRSEVGCRMSEI